MKDSSCLIINESISSNYGIDTSGLCMQRNEGVTAPIITYELTKETCAIIGGVVYRGAAIPWLDGAYLYGDFCSGQVWALVGDDKASWRTIEIADLDRANQLARNRRGRRGLCADVWRPLLRLVEAESGHVPSVTVVPSETVLPATPAVHEPRPAVSDFSMRAA